MAKSQATGLDRDYVQMAQDRDAYGIVFHLCGDSIMRGAALGYFPDQRSPAEIARDALWPLRSPGSTMNLLFREDATARPRFAGFLGAAGHPRSVAKGVSAIRRAAQAGTIRPGDFVVLEEAGHHSADPDHFEEQWDTLIAAVAETGATCIVCDTADGLQVFADAGHSTLPNTKAPIAELMFEVAFAGRSGRGRSMNAATRSAVARAAAAGLDVLLCPLQSTIGSRERGDGPPSMYRADRIHLNVWGQLAMVKAIADTAGVELPSRSPALAAIAAENHRDLAFGARDWTADAAARFMEACLAGLPGKQVRPRLPVRDARC